MEITKLLLKIISINTENPPGNEGKLADFLAKILKRKGFLILKQNINKKRKNIIACSGKSKQTSLVINAHLDTVPIGDVKNWRYNPFGEIKQGKIYGRGACDVKGSISALVSAAIKAKNEGYTNFALVFTADEESGNFLGAKRISAKLRKIFPCLRLIIVAEPTDLKIGIAHKGVVVLKLNFIGKQAHSSTPQKGINAIYSAIRAIEEILNYQNSRVAIGNSLLSRPTINIGKINGGTKVNSVPDNCQVELETRILPNEHSSKIIEKIRLIAKTHGGDIEVICSLPAFFQESNNSVKKIEKLTKKVNFKTKLIKLNYYTEAEIYKRVNKIDCLVFGAGKQEQMHTIDEFIDVKDLLLAEKIYFEIFKNFS